MEEKHQKVRFWSRVDVKQGIHQCWPWRGARSGSGYGISTFNGRVIMAHRIAFELFYDKKPVDFVLHRCNNPICVNPHHLYEGDQVANGRDYSDAVRVRKRRVSIRTRLKQEALNARH